MPICWERCVLQRSRFVTAPQAGFARWTRSVNKPVAVSPARAQRLEPLRRDRARLGSIGEHPAHPRIAGA